MADHRIVQNLGVVTRTVRKRNFGTALCLLGFVGGVYAWTYNKMRKNELTEIASELDEIRKDKQAIKPAKS